MTNGAIRKESAPPRAPSLGERLQGFAVAVAFGFFGLLRLDTASALGGFIARSIGPGLPISRLALANIRRAMPELADDEVKRILHGMWDNIGRVAAEYPHLHEFCCYEGGRIEVVGAENIDLMREDGMGGIFFSGHLGNWEIGALSATQRGVPLAQAYRAPNNPIVDRLIRAIRDRAIAGERHAKGREGGRRLARSLLEGGHLGMLIDQKQNEGIPVPFFGHEAKTMTALATFALKNRFPVVPARVERMGGAHFHITLLAPMELPDTGDKEADVFETMRRVNALLESWIRERPEQWLWLHRRWPD